MRMISKEALQALRERFPKGTRVELVKMDDLPKHRLSAQKAPCAA